MSRKLGGSKLTKPYNRQWLTKNPVELLCRLFKCTGLHPGAKYDHGSLETACDVAFLASHVYFARLKDEKVRLEAIERSALRDELAHELGDQQPEAKCAPWTKKRREITEASSPRRLGWPMARSRAGAWRVLSPWQGSMDQPRGKRVPLGLPARSRTIRLCNARYRNSSRHCALPRWPRASLWR
jgi:hypothetical protein